MDDIRDGYRQISVYKDRKAEKTDTRADFLLIIARVMMTLLHVNFVNLFA